MSTSTIIIIFVSTVALLVFLYIAFTQYRKTLREAKGYERGLKMSIYRIHLPPASEDMDSSSRDERDITDEFISKTQTMYNILAGTYVKSDFKNNI